MRALTPAMCILALQVFAPHLLLPAVALKHRQGLSKMDTLGIEPRAFRMRSGCDTTTPCAPRKALSKHLILNLIFLQMCSSIGFLRWDALFLDTGSNDGEPSRPRADLNRDRWIQSPECWPLHHEAIRVG